MTWKRTLAAVACGTVLSAVLPAQAQCYHPVFIYHGSHRHDSCAVAKPFVPGRFGGYLGLLGTTDRRGTQYLGGDLEGYYWLLPRWSTGLRGTLTGKMPTDATPETYPGIQKPLLQQYTVTWSNSLLLLDQRRWRLTLLGGVGVGGVGLYDKARQVPVNSQRASCGCTKAEEMASAVAPVTEVGMAATYKLHGKEAPWLTLRAQYRQWHGTAPFSVENQFSTSVVSVGITIPDAPARRK